MFLFLIGNYSEVPMIKPPMVLIENSLNSEQVAFMRPIYIEKMYFGTKTSGLNIEKAVLWKLTVLG